MRGRQGSASALAGSGRRRDVCGVGGEWIRSSQDHGPDLDTVPRTRPADGTAPLEAAGRLTVPRDYLAVLHRTKGRVHDVAGTPPRGRP
ncbi:hypothetical protein ABZY44_15065 [Streptomyces sp. NPDC006544]|uniref:hypothetical protein n=1 Tax=Streptomyces sp. NPDC006544 TaxID=3154583 RepID=UPI0033A2B32C